MEIRKVTQIKDGETVIGSEVKAKVVKNKVAPPFRQAHFDLMHEGGISREGDLFNLAATEHKIFDKSGSFYSYNDIRLGQGKENVKQYLRDNPALVEEVTRAILEKCGLTSGSAATPEPSKNGKPETPPAKPEKAESSGRGRKAAAAASSD
jgi:recombination protein RecA